ncbi:MAG: type II toxin-antitoxin system HicB family antitoxin [Candidatus Micrarchaeota archaeon]
MSQKLSAIITKGEIAYVALCPELDVVSQGKNRADALANLKEAVELYLEDEDVQKMLAKNPIRKAVVAEISVKRKLS